MPSARTSRRGWALNCRFAVNGIQNASSSWWAGAWESFAFMRGSLQCFCHRTARMIRKIDTRLNFHLNLPAYVYYNRRHEPGRRCPLESRTADVRAVAARVGETCRRDQRPDFLDRAEPGEPFGQFPEEGPRRYSHGARRLFHPGSRRPASGVLPPGGTQRYWYCERRAAPRRQPPGQAQHVDPSRALRPECRYRREMLTHAGEEGGVIVKGKIELTVGGESRILGPGDAYYFKSSLPHRFRNVGRDECELVSASSPPTF